MLIFFVLDKYNNLQIPIILGRPILRSNKARIDMTAEKFKLSFGGRDLTINFQLEKAEWYSSN